MSSAAAVRWWLAALIAASLAGWVGHFLWECIAAGRSLRLFDMIFVSCAVVAARECVRPLLLDLNFASKARALGAASAPPAYPHRDPVLGLDFFLALRRGLLAGTLLDDLGAAFEHVVARHTFCFLSLGRWMLMTDEPENVKAILGAHMDDWPIGGPRLWSVLYILGPRSVFASNGQIWHDARAMIRPSFVRDQVADLACFDRHIANLMAKIPRNGEAFDIQQLIQAMTMDSSTDFMLGYSTNSLNKPMSENQQFINDYDYALFESARKSRLGPILFKLPSPHFNSAIERVREHARFYTRKAISEKYSTRERGYVFLDQLVESGASEEYIVDQILSIIIAGRDTTAGAMTATFWYLARNPQAVDKIRAEIRELGVENPTWEQLKDLKYLGMVVKEALRLFPPVPTNSRVANKDTLLPRGGGPDGQLPLLVPAGMACRWSLYSMHRRKDIYGEDAEKFRPERWNDLRLTWEYLPFHGGPRICLGQQFALTQISFAVFRILQQFKNIEAADDRPKRLRVGTTASFADGCWVKMTPA